MYINFILLNVKIHVKQVVVCISETFLDAYACPLVAKPKEPLVPKFGIRLMQMWAKLSDKMI
jgi:hypothetical protein